MVNKNQIYQNASNLNGRLEEFIETLQCTKTNYFAVTDCGPGPVLKDTCFVQCLLENYCVEPTSADQPLSSCSAKQKLLLGIGYVIFKLVQHYEFNKTE